jgi:transcriptional regulator with XRE-family HTH domain
VTLDCVPDATQDDGGTVAVVPRDTVTVTRLKELRREAFLTQAEVAQRSGVSLATIIRLERGGPANLATVRRLAEALGVEPRALITPRPTDERS